MKAQKRSDGDLSEIRRFHRHLGVSKIEAGDGRALLRLGECPEIRNPRGDVHGGAIAALLDIAMSRALRSANPDARGIATVSMTANYMEPARSGLVIRARVIRNGRTLSVVEGSVENDDGRQAVQASGVFRVIGGAKESN